MPGSNGVRERRVLSLEPEVADPLRAELALVAAPGVDRVLEPVHRDLPEMAYSIRPVQQVEPARGSCTTVREQELEGESLAERGCGLRAVQRRRRVEEPQRLREDAV